jgi:GNAT superfamily N-acetyltransferase
MKIKKPSPQKEDAMFLVRAATASDAPLLAAMIRELAEFEHYLDQVDITPEDLLRDGFRGNPCFHALIAEWDGHTAGYAFYFFTYSTWAGRPSLFVEDLFVRPDFRRKGIGKALLQRMAATAREQNCYAMRWEVLNWNTPAIDFYRSLGVELQTAWFPVLFAGDKFEKFSRADDQQ